MYLETHCSEFSPANVTHQSYWPRSWFLLYW